jgi:organic radical activating enzyme
MQFLSGLDQGTPPIDEIERTALRIARGDRSELLDAWLSEGDTPVVSGHEGPVRFRKGEDGIGAVIRRSATPATLAEASAEAHAALFDFFDKNPGMHMARLWSRVPFAVEIPGALAEFRRGRVEAFARRGFNRSASLVLPPATDVPCAGSTLELEVFAAPEPPILLENKNDNAKSTARRAGDAGSRPARPSPAGARENTHIAPSSPAMARAVILQYRGRRLLLSGPASSVRGGEALHAGHLGREVRQSFENLRVLVSQFNLKPQGVEYGFGLEDLVWLRVAYARAEDGPALTRIVRRYLDPDCHVAFERRPLERPGELVEMEGAFLKKGEYVEPRRRKYALAGGRIRVESLEVHVAEHCNIRCRGCDAMSPFNDVRFLSAARVAEIAGAMARVMVADIFKLMGGEPLLHPDIAAVLGAVRRSGITDVIRLTTNGLLLHRMPDAFWQGLDRLTVSNYASAPIPPRHVELIERKAEEFEVVLNLKRIDQFNEIELTEPLEDPDEVQRNYDDCWIRHRSLIVRDGVFFKCTRAAYLDDFRTRLRLPVRQGDAASYREADGIPIDAPDFQERALAYLNEPAPLASCRYCLGAAGKLVPHTQYSKAEVRRLLGRRLDRAPPV